ncbi:phenylalanyl-tRNA synthetase beta chain [Allopseudospirillum japonicum]|uniref:Phenylalanine--tRNA ligase beta subunit n=1 Tax=Allopseudospirillum japonicum TaxID=64971 RepID=A0A1H6S4G3_9GAMM|nr:phenylalanine--tRNA ligase subunit beta [Allopseudospirillum japonicum]SEI60754.1 phenylalanyl-tRNA synthetase beta chain [Allopseudospirillum japonicum]
MKFSEHWLREWVQPQLDSQALADQLSLSGLEVDDLTPAAGDFTDVVVARIEAAEPHPNADKLQVCRVNDGIQEWQVVCGAANARAGLTTALARIGAVLPNNFKIKKAKLRQVESQGMLCAEDELGISDSHDGIMELPAEAPLGMPLRDYLGLEDTILDVDLTPNRSDCLSIAGMAREVGVLNRVPVTPVTVQIQEIKHQQQVQVKLQAPEACPKYLGRVIRKINPQARTPLWMSERLRRSGLRCLHPVVDITNYVLLELGQPMHAFDLAKVHGEIQVRMANEGEKITLLDQSEHSLQANTLVIADAQQALAVAGIMGGLSSSVDAQTQDIFLECAYFDPLAIAGRARQYGLHTDSSHRFERGVDFALQAQALERATELVLAIAGGEAGPVTEAVYPEYLPQVAPIRLRRQRLAQVLATELADTEVEDILTRLGLELTSTAEGWLAKVPSYRFDLSIEADLIEEIARVYGYDRLPVKTPQARLGIQALPESQVKLARLRDVLVTLGYQEAISFSFIDPKWAQAFAPEQAKLTLANPISADLSVMRPTLMAGLVKALAYNQKRQQTRVRLFETGLSFVTATGQVQDLLQTPQLAGAVAGSKAPENWTHPTQPIDFYDVKGDVEALLQLSGPLQDFSFKAEVHPALHPGQSARIYKRTAAGQQALGWLGALHPQLMQTLDVKGPIFVFELDLNCLRQGQVARFQGVSRFPEVRRDLAVLVPTEIATGEVLDEVRRLGGTYLQEVVLFDVYQGPGIEKEVKSLALGLTLQDSSRTLNEEEVNQQLAEVLAGLKAKFGAYLRS